ncbi:unnamed protein product, partial [Linum tenue]
KRGKAGTSTEEALTACWVARILELEYLALVVRHSCCWKHSFSCFIFTVSSYWCEQYSPLLGVR